MIISSSWRRSCQGIFLRTENFKISKYFYYSFLLFMMNYLSRLNSISFYLLSFPNLRFFSSYVFFFFSNHSFLYKRIGADCSGHNLFMFAFTHEFGESMKPNSTHPSYGLNVYSVVLFIQRNMHSSLGCRRS